MRVLHVQKATGIAGSERHLLALLPVLVQGGVEVKMLLLTGGDFQRFLTPLVDAGIDAATIPAGPDINPLLIGRLTREIKRYRPDIVHTHLIHGDVYGQFAAAIAGPCGVSSVHSTPSFAHQQPYLAALRRAHRRAKRTIAISEHVRRFLVDLRIAKPEVVRVVHYGIDPSKWVIGRAEQTRAREELGIKAGEVVVGMAARFVPIKGHNFLLDAFAHALPQAGNLRLLLAGDGPLRESLERKVRESFLADCVRFVGHLQNLTSFMNVCDLLVFPTKAPGEGFGLAALEAMAASRPVIATAVGAFPEIVKERETGYLVAPEAREELARALVALGEDTTLRAQMGSSGRLRAEQAFSLQAMADRTLSVYHEAID
jgi:glycosyltransferase involved in cell wall biosynthesis